MTVNLQAQHQGSEGDTAVINVNRLLVTHVFSLHLIQSRTAMHAHSHC